VTASTLFALTLARLLPDDWTATGWLVRHVGSFEALQDTSPEALQPHLGHRPESARLLAQLFNAAFMQKMQEQAKAELATLITKRIRVLTPHDEDWPAGLEALPEHQRPFLLFAYGNLELLAQPTVALLARPPISELAYDRAQDLTLHLIEAGCVPVTGALSGFDVALQKLCHNAPRPHPAIMVAHTGLSQLLPPMRPVAAATLRAGGLLLSPFLMELRPSDRRDRQRALVQAALAQAAVFVEPRDETPEHMALDWAVQAHRPVFGISTRTMPEVHPIRESVDFEWVVEAARRTSPAE